MRIAIIVVLLLTIPGWTAPALAGTALAPDAAPPGATVTITGAGFGSFKSSQENRVLFNQVPALVQRWEADLVSVKVPLRAATGPVEIVRGKKRIPAGTFTVLRPTIQSVAPGETEPGTVLQIIGAHFGNTAGSKDPNTMFGVNDVLISGVPARVRRWRDDKIEAEVPANATTGDVLVRLASSDPLPDGSCCAPVEYSVSNAVALTVLPSIRVDPLSGPVGTKVVFFGKGFGAGKTSADAVLFGGRPATVSQWTDQLIVAHVPLNAVSGPLVLKQGSAERTLGQFAVQTPKATGLSPASAPIGSLLRITGEHFGFYSESGATPYAFADFNKGENGVEIGGVPAIIYRWHDDRIDVWVPYSVKSGPVVIKRGANVPKADGSCCAERGLVTTEAGTFSLVTPKVESFSPDSAGLDEIVTIRCSGFGIFLKTTVQTLRGLQEGGHDCSPIQLGEIFAGSDV
ncbi:MAG: IPT/TIG domain-containing protein, partial [Nitrospiraceae bacterium]